MPNKTPWGPIGYFTFKRTYARKTESGTEEFPETIKRILDACDTQLAVGFTPEERIVFESQMLGLKGSVAGRFLWQLGTGTVDKLGLMSLQNCAVIAIDEPVKPFTWIFDALMLGCGVGFNLQKEFVFELPKVKGATVVRKDSNDADFIVPDSREGWVKLLHEVLTAHFITGKGFSYSTVLIRGKGAAIKSFGGVASGPEELCWGMAQIGDILNKRIGKKIRPIDALDICNIIGYIVVSGNVRRSAQIAIGDSDDPLFLNAKRWDLGNIPNWRAMSNNSVACSDISHLSDSFWKGYEGNGEPYGLINLKLARTMGRTGDFSKKDKDIIGFNPCQPAWATVLTPDGIRCLGEVKVGDKIWSGKTWTEITNKWSTGTKPVFRYRTTAGSFVGTENHRVLSSGLKVEVKDADSIDTAIGPNPDKKVMLNQQDVMDGLVLCDGMVPSRFRYAASGKVRGFLRGLFSANGSLSGNRVTLKQSSLMVIEQVQEMLSGLGIRSYVTTNKSKEVKFSNGTYPCKQSYDLNISTDQNKFYRLIGFIQPYKTEVLQEIIAKREAAVFTRSPKSTFDIVDVTLLGEDEVFDLTVDDPDHTYWTGGLLVSNCGEQGLHNGETCCLAELFLPNLSSLEEAKSVAKNLYRVCKHSLALPCHQEITEKVVHKNMRMGIGVTGYLQATEEQRQWLPELYTYLREYDKQYSLAHDWPESIKLTTCKPSGTLSLLAGVTPGVHPGIYQRFIRRVRVASGSPLVQQCRDHGYPVEFQKAFDGSDDRNTMVVSFPCSYPEGTTLAKDTAAVDQLEAVARVQRDWSDNAVSCTVYYRPEELPAIKEWLKKNYSTCLKTVSFLLHQDHGFIQAPYEEIDLDAYLKMMGSCKPFASESISTDELMDSLECTTGACPIK
jgi:hypothetical protein